MSTAVDQANEFLTNYSFDELKKAIKRIERIRNPAENACRCNSCLHTVVNEVNQWLEFLESEFKGNVSGRYEVDTDCNGKLEIVFISHQL